MNLDDEVKQLILLFNNLFNSVYNVLLCSQPDEPLYTPSKTAEQPNIVYFANGYFNSALHEIAHWVIAGEQRRLVKDYGYWYCEDGRSSKQQQRFEAVEILPQAIEKEFCMTIGRKFSASVDNLDSPIPQAQIIAFENNIERKRQQLLTHGFPLRAREFINALTEQFN